MAAKSKLPTPPPLPQTASRVDFTDWTDGQLLQEYASRFSEDAFTALYNRHQASLHRYVMRKFSFDDSAADDVTQAVWIKVAAKCRDEIQNFSAWARSVAFTSGMDHLRSLDGHDSLTAITIEPVAKSIEPIDSMIVAESVQVLRTRIVKLDKTKRTAISCVYTHGMTVPQTARQLGVSVTTVEKHLRLAKRKLMVA